MGKKWYIISLGLVPRRAAKSLSLVNERNRIHSQVAKRIGIVVSYCLPIEISSCSVRHNRWWEFECQGNFRQHPEVKQHLWVHRLRNLSADSTNLLHLVVSSSGDTFSFKGFQVTSVPMNLATSSCAVLGSDLPETYFLHDRWSPQNHTVLVVVSFLRTNHI